MFIQTQTTATISSLTTSTTIHETALVPASSALSVERQEHAERDGKQQRNRERLSNSLVSKPVELSTCTLKSLPVFSLSVN